MKKNLNVAALSVVVCTWAGASLAMTPSSLADCMTMGWQLKRLTQAWSFSFMPAMSMPSACVAEFTISPEEPQLENGWRAEIEDPYRPREGDEVEYEFMTQIPASTLMLMRRGSIVTTVRRQAEWDNRGASVREALLHQV